MFFRFEGELRLSLFRTIDNPPPIWYNTLKGFRGYIMRKNNNVGNSAEEMLILEADELGWEVVYKDGTFYHKKTIIHDNATVRTYHPIPFEKRKTTA